MKIEKFSKNRNGMYIITLEDKSKIKIHEDLILKYNLLLTKQITNSLLEEIHKENQVYEIYEIALKYLKVKLRTKKELKNYLLKKNYDDEHINNVIEMFIKQGYLNDEIYVTSYIHDKILMSNDGPNKIKNDLYQAGIANEIVDNKLIIFTEELEKERIEKLINKQIKSNHNKGSIVLKQKIQYYLINLGYNQLLINEVLDGKKLVSEDTYKKEYDKLYTKLSKKYSGKELEYKLKQKMYQKGFNEYEYK